jgi:hypothetical protein
LEQEVDFIVEVAEEFINSPLETALELAAGAQYMNNYNNDEPANAGQPNSFTHLRALLVSHDRGIQGYAI